MTLFIINITLNCLIVSQQVDEVQHLLESFTSLTIKKRHEGGQGITPLDPQPTTQNVIQ